MCPGMIHDDESAARVALAEKNNLILRSRTGIDILGELCIYQGDHHKSISPLLSIVTSLYVRIRRYSNEY